MNLENDYDNDIYNGSLGFITSIEKNMAYRGEQINLKNARIMDLNDYINSFKDAPIEKSEHKELTTRQASHITVVEFDNGYEKVLSTTGDYLATTMGYAMTCYKAQGSQFDNVILVCDNISKGKNISKEYLYTGYTRTMNAPYLFYNRNKLIKALNTSSYHGLTWDDKINNKHMVYLAGLRYLKQEKIYDHYMHLPYGLSSDTLNAYDKFLEYNKLKSPPKPPQKQPPKKEYKL